MDSRWFGLSRPCGVSNPKDPKNFQWIDGTTVYSVSDTNWDTNQPNNYIESGLSSEQACVVMSGRNNLTWDDVSCDEMYMFVCQYRILNQRMK